MDGEGLAATVLDELDDLLCRVGAIDIIDRDSDSFVRQRDGDPASDAPRRARNQGDLAIQVEVHPRVLAAPRALFTSRRRLLSHTRFPSGRGRILLRMSI